MHVFKITLASLALVCRLATDFALLWKCTTSSLAGWRKDNQRGMSNISLGVFWDAVRADENTVKIEEEPLDLPVKGGTDFCNSGGVNSQGCCPAEQD
ncbi:hypothetical protein MJO29_002564, partial [Puccinia striiformis f. sp. tritici]